MLRYFKLLVRLVLRCLGIALFHAGLARAIIQRSSHVRAVLYHAVETRRSSYTDGLGVSVTPDTFALHLDYYQRYYTVVSMQAHLHKAGQAESKKARPELLITFDDGYASVMDNALPLLEARGMCATNYLIGNAVRGRMVWVNRLNQAINLYPVPAREVLNAYPGLKGLGRQSTIHRIQTSYSPRQIDQLILKLENTIPQLTCSDEKLFSSPDDIRQMQQRGMAFGFHTNDHWNLSNCKDKELASTLATDGLEHLINSNTFAYPFGYFAPSAIGKLSRQGYQKLMTVGTNNGHFCDLHLGRTEVFEPTMAGMFARLEIEEPLISTLSRWAHRIRRLSSKPFHCDRKRTV